MKYMKLGSKPDMFKTDGNNVRYVASDLAPDIIVNVGGVKFHLHKFPLLPKSNKLQKLIIRANEEGYDVINIDDIPGGTKTFKMCVKFCYGMKVTLNAYNVVATRYAAEYLEMTDDVEKGNLIYKIEVFLNSSIFRSWKDSIIVLQTTKPFVPLTDELKIIERCVNSIASKTSVDPSNVHWSYTYNKKLSLDGNVDDSKRYQLKAQLSIPKDWWIEDMCELEIDLYEKVMIAIKSQGSMPSEIIADALRVYAMKWLPNSINALVSDGNVRKNRILVETIVSLLPLEKGCGCTCSFLLKLLKVVNLIGIEGKIKEDLMDGIGLQLDSAFLKDLLIPSWPPSSIIYDVGLVHNLVERFLMQDKGRNCENDARNSNDFMLGNVSILAVGKLVDGYLAEIACDANLPLTSFIRLSSLLPDVARPIHDMLYAAIDIYLQGHSSLTKEEKKDLCGLIDARRLSDNACTLAVQNERLPLRVITQILYHEMTRVASLSSKLPGDPLKHGSHKDIIAHCKSSKAHFDTVKSTLEEQSAKGTDGAKSGKTTVHNLFLLPSRSRRVLNKLLPVKTMETNRKSDTSGSSQSPPSINLADIKMSGSSSTRRRYSIS